MLPLGNKLDGRAPSLAWIAHIGIAEIFDPLRREAQVFFTTASQVGGLDAVASGARAFSCGEELEYPLIEIGERALVESAEARIVLARSRLSRPSLSATGGEFRIQRIEQRIDVGQPLGFADLVAGDGDVALCLAVEFPPHTVGAWYIITGAMQRVAAVGEPNDADAFIARRHLHIGARARDLVGRPRMHLASGRIPAIIDINGAYI